MEDYIIFSATTFLSKRLCPSVRQPLRIKFSNDKSLIRLFSEGEKSSNVVMSSDDDEAVASNVPSAVLVCLGYASATRQINAKGWRPAAKKFHWQILCISNFEEM